MRPGGRMTQGGPVPPAEAGCIGADAPMPAAEQPACRSLTSGVFRGRKSAERDRYSAPGAADPLAGAVSGFGGSGVKSSPGLT